MSRTPPFPPPFNGRRVPPCLLAFLVLAHLTPAAPLLEFRVPPAFPAGDGPMQIVSGDFNTDGIVDIATANFDDSTVGVLLGLGGGAYAPVRQYNVGSFPDSIAVGDLNGDGLPDLATANGNGWNKPGTLSVLLGSDNGLFTLQPVVPVDRGPRGVVIADFDGDGNHDLATAISGGWFATNKVNIAFGNGDGTFAPVVPYTVGNNPNWIATADFNGDGRPDIVTSTYGGPANVLLNQGAREFAPMATYATGLYSIFVACADLNEDGTPDLIVANGATDPVNVLLGRGDGTFDPATQLGSAMGQLAVMDFNDDGHLDLAGLTGSVTILLGTGTGSFQPPSSYEIGSANMALAAGNFIGDTNTDLAVAGWYGNDVRLLTGTGDGTFAGGTPTLDAPGGLLFTADLNKDGQLDLVTHASDGNSVNVILQRTNGVFGPGMEYDTGGPVNAAKAGDFNNDGWPDIVVAHSAGFISVLTNNPSQPNQADYGAYSRFEIPGIHEDIEVAYVDGDTNLDVIVPSYYESNLIIALGDGTGDFHTPPPPVALNGFPRSIVAADFDLDGHTDVAVADGSGTITVVRGNGDGTFGSSIGLWAPDTTHFVRAGDLNGDGKPDLVQALDDSAYISVMLNTSSTGNISFAQAKSHPVANGPVSVAIADFNGDNLPDIASGNYGSVSVIVGNGDGTFLDATNYFGGGTLILAGDFNGDAMPDLAISAASSVGLFWNDTLPRLQIEKASAGVRIAWPAWKPYEIQTTDGLTQPLSWTAITTAPATIGNQFVLTNAAPSALQLYRLRR